MKTRSPFHAYYLPDEKSLKRLWNRGTVALDANVLLNLYRYPVLARSDLLSGLEKISERLFVPYQATLEYQRNRLEVIASQRRRFDEVRKVLADAQNKLSADLGKLQLKKRHSSIDPSQLLTDIEHILNKFRDDLVRHEKDQLDITGKDEIRSTIDRLIDGKIGKLSDQAALDKIYKEGKKRYEDRVPPGYSDAHKAESGEPVYFSNGIRIERQFGDLIFWTQLMEMASERKLKHLILITDDEKEDWWWVVESNGEKTIGPRPELVEEMCEKTGVKDFYIYTSERFLYYARQYLDLKVRDQSIDEVRSVRQSQAARGWPYGFSGDAVDAAYFWLNSRYGGLTTRLNVDEWEITYEDVNGIVAGYQIHVLSEQDSRDQIDFIADSLRSDITYPNILGMRHFGFIIVLEHERFRGKVEDAIAGITLPPNVGLAIGVVQLEPNKKPIFVPLTLKNEAST
jgi:hypothetical protein